MSLGARRGVRLGVDVGKVRVGVARSDPDGILASPLITLTRDLSATGGGGGAGPSAGEAVPVDIAQLAALVRENEAVEVVVGLPVTLAGREALAAADARGYSALLARAIDPVPVRLSDERMTTVVASRRLSERGVRGRRQRAVVDQVAAVEILQGWLDNQRRRTQ
ncbi:Holliday junction resolvase RuvX [Rugosimonospora africana]|uniref:Putative pre-16S rRNA nuclease n=1 Tax=Rugosimonospora africana TaxID=556532 RepID=A0A8J3QX01_9ACTN|nr:Holliday junction resolvase RuvX [Rugosimonospora africana]GIH17348.1 putative pre-16S rRNA nuclease [Rugosimonospora africana]